MSKIEQACAYMENLVNDNSHGYDQIHRWGPDYDCSSSIITAWETGAGVMVKTAGATYTGNMASAFVKCGFQKLKYARNMGLKRGDVLLNEKHHAAFYLGGRKIAQFSINENGKATGGRTGDQTGREACICNFYEYSKGWDYVLRYPESEEVINVQVNMRQIQKGDICVEVGMLQTLLNKLGYKGSNGRALTVDNDFGANCDYAVKNFQKSKGLNPDGIVGAKTWDFLVKSNYV